MCARIRAALLALALVGAGSTDLARADPVPADTPTPPITQTPAPESPPPESPTPDPTDLPVSSSTPTNDPGAPGSPADPLGRTSPRWVRRVDHLVAGHHVSVAVGYQGSFLYRHDSGVRRIPASNEKLLLSMAVLDEMGPDLTIPTRVREIGRAHV